MYNIKSTTFNRYKILELKDKINKKQSFLLLGPRQTGKSFLIELLFKELNQQSTLQYYFQLPSHRQRAEQDPEFLLREVEAKSQNHTTPVFLWIDEIQKVPSVLDVLQFLIDKKQVVLVASGSSARKMKNLGINRLPGRIVLEYLFPLTWEECGLLEKKITNDEVLLYGSLPKILATEDLPLREEIISTYTQLYLEEEIRLEAVVRNLPHFSKFLKLAALESGTSPNFSKLGNQVGVSPPTIREYYQILEDTLILHRIDSFGKSRDQTLRTPKYYFFDIGVRNAAAGIGHSRGILELQRGVLFEHFIILELLAHYKQKAKLSYWRTKKQEEVDLLLEKDGNLFAIEIKATSKPQTQDFKNLDVFIKNHKPHKTMLVCQVEQAQKFGPHLAVPWQHLHQELV